MVYNEVGMIIRKEVQNDGFRNGDAGTRSAKQGKN
jgi:hypothetical protein